MDLSITGVLVLRAHLASVGQDPGQGDITTVHSQHCPLEQTLNRVTAFVELPGAEGVVVADDSGLRRFDAEGRVFTIAGVGPGPREVRMVSALVVGESNTVYALDPIARRVSWFEADTLVNGFRIPDNIPTWGLHRLVVLAGPRLAITIRYRCLALKQDRSSRFGPQHNAWRTPGGMRCASARPPLAE